MIKWMTETRNISDLVPAEYNPRQLTDKQADDLNKSLARFNLADPIIINSNNTIIGGHQRIKVLESNGVSTVDVRVPNRELSEAEEKELNLRLNRNLGQWDMELLKDFTPEMLLDVGFDTDELDNIFPVEVDPKDDEVPDLPDEPTAIIGDIYLLGKHRVMCGDSTNVDDVEKLMDGSKADMVFTDPPYRMDAQGGSNQPIGRAAAKLGESIKDLCDFNPVDFLGMLPLFFKARIMNSYVFCNKDLVPDYLNWAKEAGYSFNILVWKKPNAIPLGGNHRPDVEYLLLFRKGAIWNNSVKGVNYSRCLEFGRESSTPHPTMKPVELITNEIQISSNRSSVVVDVFLGSGSTLIACEKTNRICYGMELDPKYVDVIVQRWEEYTGGKAVKCAK